MSHPTRELCEFLSAFGWNDIPPPVIETTKGLFLDWFASALAGKDSRPVRAFQAFARQAGPATGPSEVLVDRGSTSPFFAALVNAASSHVVEQDDVHNGAVFHPGTVVFPAVLALAQAEKKSGKEFLLAAIAGYETGIRVGEFLGRSHYTVFHTTGRLRYRGTTARGFSEVGSWMAANRSRCLTRWCWIPPTPAPWRSSTASCSASRTARATNPQPEIRSTREVKTGW